MSDFRKYLGLSEEDEALVRKLASPADMAAQGASSMGESAGRALSGLGAKLDARLGTTARARPPREPDPLLPQESPPQVERGLFETLGHAVPNVAAMLGGNALPMAAPAMPGAVAAFPSPKQSLARMKEEAVFRDMMEAKGAKAITPGPTGESLALRRPDLEMPPLPPKGDERGLLESHSARRAQAADDALRIDNAAAANYDRIPETYPGAPFPLPETDFTWVGESAGRRASALSPNRERSWPNPDAKIPREQSELERYLAGLYGPKAGK